MTDWYASTRAAGPGPTLSRPSRRQFKWIVEGWRAYRVLGKVTCKFTEWTMFMQQAAVVLSNTGTLHACAACLLTSVHSSAPPQSCNCDKILADGWCLVGCEQQVHFWMFAADRYLVAAHIFLGLCRASINAGGRLGTDLKLLSTVVAVAACLKWLELYPRMQDHTRVHKSALGIPACLMSMTSSAMVGRLGRCSCSSVYAYGGE